MFRPSFYHWSREAVTSGNNFMRSSDEDISSMTSLAQQHIRMSTMSANAHVNEKTAIPVALEII